jgi:uncharacterized protein YaiL (DUF2058 family)
MIFAVKIKRFNVNAKIRQKLKKDPPLTVRRVNSGCTVEILSLSMIDDYANPIPSK